MLQAKQPEVRRSTENDKRVKARSAGGRGTRPQTAGGRPVSGKGRTVKPEGLKRCEGDGERLRATVLSRSTGRRLVIQAARGANRQRVVTGKRKVTECPASRESPSVSNGVPQSTVAQVEVTRR